MLAAKLYDVREVPQKRDIPNGKYFGYWSDHNVYFYVGGIKYAGVVGISHKSGRELVVCNVVVDGDDIGVFTNE